MTQTSLNGPGHDRKLYRILRGSYSRREGFEQPHVDPETGKKTRRKSQPFVHYSARTPRNPTARDEVYLSDAEARAFGMQNLKRLHKGNVEASIADDRDVDELMKRDLPEDPADKVSMLIEEGELIRKRRQLDVWRTRVHEADVLEVELPNKRMDLLELLKRIDQEGANK